METEHKHQSAKYDRQLRYLIQALYLSFRLWGVQGQKILMESKICLLSCDPAGVETLKNLILPGIGSVTIVDDQLVTDRDLGNNFFVTEENLGKNRAEVNIKFLYFKVKGCQRFITRIESRCERRSYH